MNHQTNRLAKTRLRSLREAVGQRPYWLLFGCLLLAAALRLWGLNYGLPYTYHPDEAVAVVTAQNMVKTGDLNPHFYDWSSLLFYLNALLYGAYYLVGHLFGLFQTTADIPAPVVLVMGVGWMPMASMWLLSRLLTLLFGLGSVLLTFASGRTLLQKTAVGLLAAFFLAISPTNVAHSRYIAPDTLALFFVMLTFYGSTKVYRDGRARFYLLTGVALGLAVASKYNSGLIVLAFVAAHFLRHGRHGFKRRWLYLTPIAALAAFLAAMPYALLDSPAFLEGLQRNSAHYATGHAGMEGETLRFYVSYLWRVEGLVFVVAVGEIARGVYGRSRETMLLAVFPVAYFIFISSFAVRNDRTLMPVLPFLFLLAANGLVWAWSKVRTNSGRPTVAFTAVMAGLGLLLVFVPLQGAVQGAINLTRTTSRETARVWIAENLPAGAQVALEPYAPFVDPQQFSATGFDYLYLHTAEWYAENGFEYLVFAQGSYGRFFRAPDRYVTEIAAYDQLWNQLEPVQTFHDGGYEVKIYAVPK